MADNLIAVLRAITNEQDTLKSEITDTLDILDIDTVQNGELDRVAEIVGEPPALKMQTGIMRLATLIIEKE